MKRDREERSTERINESSVESKPAGLHTCEAVIMASIRAISVKKAQTLT